MLDGPEMVVFVWVAVIGLEKVVCQKIVMIGLEMHVT